MENETINFNKSQHSFCFRYGATGTDVNPEELKQLLQEFRKNSEKYKEIVKDIRKSFGGEND